MFRYQIRQLRAAVRRWLLPALKGRLLTACAMIARKPRFFVPTTDEGPAILTRLMQRHRLLDVVSRT